MRPVLPALLLAVSAAAADPEPAWSPAEISSLLATFGYTDIANLRRNGPTFTADATRYGVPLHGITIDAETGDVLDAPPLTPMQAGALLRAKGYTAVSAVRSASDVEGQSIAARATDRSGVTGVWTIDPWSGAVYPAGAE